MIVYQIGRGTEVLCTGWGPDRLPLSIIAAVPEVAWIAEGVASSELTMTVLLGGVSRVVAARAVELLAPRSSKEAGVGRGGRPVIVVRDGRTERFPSITRAAASCGVNRVDCSRMTHHVGGVSIYCPPGSAGPAGSAGPDAALVMLRTEKS